MRFVKFSPSWLHIIAILLPVMLLIILWFQNKYPLDDLFRDPLDVALGTGHGKIYYGLMSNIGVLMWCTTSAVCTFACLQGYTNGAPTQKVAYLASAGAISAILMVDDMFYGHEVLFPYLLRLGEKFVFLLYAVIVFIHLTVFRNLIFDRENSLLIGSLVFFIGGLATDLLWHEPNRIRRILEDGVKFLGITTWTLYHLRMSWLISREAN